MKQFTHNRLEPAKMSLCSRQPPPAVGTIQNDGIRCLNTCATIGEKHGYRCYILLIPRIRSWHQN